MGVGSTYISLENYTPYNTNLGRVDGYVVDWSWFQETRARPTNLVTTKVIHPHTFISPLGNVDIFSFDYVSIGCTICKRSKYSNSIEEFRCSIIGWPLQLKVEYDSLISRWVYRVKVPPVSFSHTNSCLRGEERAYESQVVAFGAGSSLKKSA